jgi:hypothetical protein
MVSPVAAMMTELQGATVAKPGPKAKENSLSVRVQFRVSADTMTAYAALAEVLEMPTHQLMRQALDDSAGAMLTMANAFRQAKGGDQVKGLELYRQFLDTLGPQMEEHQGATDELIQQAGGESRKAPEVSADLGDETAERHSNTFR